MREKVSKKEEQDRKLREQQENRNVMYMGQHTTVAAASGLPPAVQQNYWISKCSDVFWGVAPFVLFASFMYIVQLVLKSS